MLSEGIHLDEHVEIELNSFAKTSLHIFSLHPEVLENQKV